MRRKTLTNIRQKELVYGNLRSKIDSLIEAKKHRLKKRRRGNDCVDATDAAQSSSVYNFASGGGSSTKNFVIPERLRKRKTKISLSLSLPVKKRVIKEDKVIYKKRRLSENSELSELENSDRSPIKTRGIKKKGERNTNRCRVCKNNIKLLITCFSCHCKYHLTCLGYIEESASLIYKTRYLDWICPSCLVCSFCGEFIADPENVQCFNCDRAFHGICRPKNGKWANSKNPVGHWCCDLCNIGSIKSNFFKSLCDKIKSDATRQTEKNVSKYYRYVSSIPFSTNKDVQNGRNEINNRLKDLYKAKLAEEEKRGREDKLLRSNIENFKPKRQSKFLPGSHKKHTKVRNFVSCSQPIKEAELKISIKEKQKSFESIYKRMKEISTDFDYDLFMEAKEEAEKDERKRENGSEENRTQCVHFGNHRVLAQYVSAYPRNLASAQNLYICRFCLLAFENIVKYEIHVQYCEWRHPPGNEIYRKDGLSFWELDGDIEMGYCRRLCLFSKLFLSSKTLHHEVETFLFYLLTENTPEGCVLLGYFSKEKNPGKNNNLSCLLTLPFSQRDGYGKFLIDLSYKLSLRERKIGGPEHPLSDLGLLTYRSYWKNTIFSYLRRKRYQASISIKDLSHESGIHPSDLIGTLLENNMLKIRNGLHMINLKKAVNAPLHTFRRRVVDDEKLIWEPEFDVEDSQKMGTYTG